MPAFPFLLKCRYFQPEKLPSKFFALHFLLPLTAWQYTASEQNEDSNCLIAKHTHISMSGTIFLVDSFKIEYEELSQVRTCLGPLTSICVCMFIEMWHFLLSMVLISGDTYNL